MGYLEGENGGEFGCDFRANFAWRLVSDFLLIYNEETHVGFRMDFNLGGNFEVKLGGWIWGL